jgi:hypothetical protein
MAEHKVQPSTMLLLIDPNGGTNYSTVVCLKSISKNDSVAAIDASSACGYKKLAGIKDLSYSCEGLLLQDPNSGNISGTKLRILLRGYTNFGFKITPLTPQIGDEIEEGKAFFSAVSSSYSFDDVGSFSAEFYPIETPTLTIFEGPQTGYITTEDLIDILTESNLPLEIE